MSAYSPHATDACSITGQRADRKLIVAPGWASQRKSRRIRLTKNHIRGLLAASPIRGNRPSPHHPLRKRSLPYLSTRHTEFCSLGKVSQCIVYHCTPTGSEIRDQVTSRFLTPSSPPTDAPRFWQLVMTASLLWPRSTRKQHL